SRNLFGVSWAFTEEIGSLLLIVVTFGGLGYAARHRRHIAMSALYDLLADGGREKLGWVVSAVSAATMLVMAYLGARYAIQIYASGDTSNVLGIPMFLPLSVIPVGFLLAAVRFVTDLWPLPGHGTSSGADVETSWEDCPMEWVILAITLAMLLLGFPMMVVMLVAALALWMTYLPTTEPSIVVQQLVSSVEPYVLMAIPLFIFAADIMSAGRTSKYLLDLVQKTIGRMRGGTGIATAAAATGFGAVSGSSQATVAAIGPPMRTEALRVGYSDSHILALLVNASSLALLIPPSTVMIYYGTLTSTSVGNLFLAGIIPGVLIFILFAGYEHVVARVRGIPTSDKSTAREKLAALRRAALTLGLPVLILGSIYIGIATP